MNEQTEKKKPSGCLIAAGVGVVLLVLMASCDVQRSDDELDTAEVAEAALAEVEGMETELGSDDEKSAEPSKPASKWSYNEVKDELRNKTRYTASISSNNSVNFGFPYQGDQNLRIGVRDDPQWGDDVYFSVERGQMICGIYDCKGSISFDGNAEGLTLVPSGDRDSTVLFAKYPRAIINKLKNSERVVVEITFYQEGNRQFIFDTAGLEWNH